MCKVSKFVIRIIYNKETKIYNNEKDMSEHYLLVAN